MKVLKIFLGFVLCLTACQARKFGDNESEQKMAMAFTQQVDGRDVQRVLIYFYNDMYNMLICKQKNLSSEGLETVSDLLTQLDCSEATRVSLTAEQFEAYFKIVFAANFEKSPELFLKNAKNPIQVFATAIKDMYVRQKAIVDKSSSEVAWIGFVNGLLAFVSSRAAQQNKARLDGLKTFEEKNKMFSSLIGNIQTNLLDSSVTHDQDYYNAAMCRHILMFIRESGLYTHTAQEISSTAVSTSTERNVPTTTTRNNDTNVEPTQAFAKILFSTSAKQPVRKRPRSGGDGESVVIDVNNPDSSQYPLKIRDYNPTNVADFYFGIIADVFSLAKIMSHIER